MNRDTATFCDSCGINLIEPVDPTPKPDRSAGDRPIEGATRPETLPEDRVGLADVRRDAGISPDGWVQDGSIRPPNVSPGPPTGLPRKRRIRIAIVFALLGAILTAMIDPSAPPEAMLTFGIVAGIGALLLSVPLALFLNRCSTMGIVTHLQDWYPHDQNKRKLRPNWVFDLRLTDRDWQPLHDSRGFLLPIVETEFRSDKIHGPALEEGSRVIMRGTIKSDRVIAGEIWNLTPASADPTHSRSSVFWGQVIGWQPRQAMDMRYPGQRHLEVWNFRLQQTDENMQKLHRDPEGNLQKPLPVEIRAQAIAGSIQDGDKVEVHGQLVKGTLYAREVRNHSAGGSSLVIKGWAGIP
jgi:hypothetical protein